MEKETKKKFFIGGISAASILGAAAAMVLSFQTAVDNVREVIPQFKKQVVEMTNAEKPETFTDFLKQNLWLFGLSGAALGALVGLDIHRGKRYLKDLDDKAPKTVEDLLNKMARDKAWRDRQRPNATPDEILRFNELDKVDAEVLREYRENQALFAGSYAELSESQNDRNLKEWDRKFILASQVNEHMI